MHRLQSLKQELGACLKQLLDRVGSMNRARAHEIGKNALPNQHLDVDCSVCVRGREGILIRARVGAKCVGREVVGRVSSRLKVCRIEM